MKKDVRTIDASFLGFGLIRVIGYPARLFLCGFGPATVVASSSSSACQKGPLPWDSIST